MAMSLAQAVNNAKNDVITNVSSKAYVHYYNVTDTCYCNWGKLKKEWN